MTDLRNRKLERAIAQGDPEARVALLRERMRSGELAHDAVELAAYCEDKVALALFDLIPDEAPIGFRWPLSAWLSGLTRWPYAPVRAALAAGWVAWKAHECRECMDWAGSKWLCRHNNAPRRALEAAERWLADPSEAHREAWWLVVRGEPLPAWVLYPLPKSHETAIHSAVLLTSLATVRKAICDALAKWALK